MSEKIAQLNEEVIKGQIKELVRGREADPSCPVRTQCAAAEVSQRPLQPQPHHHFRRRYPEGTQAQRDFI